MGNRDALLGAAKRCLLEKGYARTTARDIASAAGVSLAAIGYHFASKDALLTEALLLAFREWDEELQTAFRTGVSASLSPRERFEAVWENLMATFETHRSLWIANFEIFTQMLAQPETRGLIAASLPKARTALAAMFLNREESAISEHTWRTTGTLLHVILSGLLVQWLIDPASAISAKELTEAFRSLTEILSSGKKAFSRGTKPNQKKSKRRSDDSKRKGPSRPK